VLRDLGTDDLRPAPDHRTDRDVDDPPTLDEELVELLAEDLGVTPGARPFPDRNVLDASPRPEPWAQPLLASRGPGPG
jgi:hypothetical protein